MLLQGLIANRDTVNSAKEAVAAMIKRLAHRNANVQLYTLEVCAISVCMVALLLT